MALEVTEKTAARRNRREETGVGPRLVYSGTGTVFRHLNARFARLGTGVTHPRKFKDRGWTLLFTKTLAA